MTEAELEEIRALGHLGMKPGACSGGEECRFRGAIDDLIGEIERLRGVVEAAKDIDRSVHWVHKAGSVGFELECMVSSVAVELFRLALAALEEGE
jgi:hypothetical protein